MTLIRTLRTQEDYFSVQELLQEVIDRTGYVKELEAEGTEEARARIENIDELIKQLSFTLSEALNMVFAHGER